MSEAGLDPFTAFVVRSTVKQTAVRAAYVATLSAELRGHLERGDAKLAGQTAGTMLRWSMLLIDAGAELHDVRALIAVGAGKPTLGDLAAAAAQTCERVA